MATRQVLFARWTPNNGMFVVHTGTLNGPDADGLVYSHHTSDRRPIPPQYDALGAEAETHPYTWVARTA